MTQLKKLSVSVDDVAALGAAVYKAVSTIKGKSETLTRFANAITADLTQILTANVEAKQERNNLLRGGNAAHNNHSGPRMKL